MKLKFFNTPIEEKNICPKIKSEKQICCSIKG